MLLYAEADKRTPRFILRLHNVSFLHAMLCKKIFLKTHSLTRRKLYGIYFHSIVVETPIIARPVSPSSYNTEEEERLFSDISSISKVTSSRKAGHLLDNSIIRLQAERNFKTENGGTTRNIESEISRFAKSLPSQQNTYFRSDIISTDHYQAHLERIADFLTFDSQGKWWLYSNYGIEVLDGSDEEEFCDDGPALQHFRSSTLNYVRNHLQQSWKKSIEDDVTLPTSKITIYDEEGEYLATRLNKDFIDNEGDDETNSVEEKENNADQPATEEHTSIDTFLDVCVEFVGTANPIDSEQESHCDDETSCTLPVDECTLTKEGPLPDQAPETPNEPDNFQSHTTSLDTPQRLSGQPCQQEETPDALISSRQSYRDDTDKVSEPKKLFRTPHTSRSTEANDKNLRKHTLQSTLANNIAKVIGLKENVSKLDRLRQSLRESPNSQSLKHSYEALLTSLQTEVLSHHSDLKRKIAEWEKECAITKNCALRGEANFKMDSSVKELYDRFFMSKRLLNHWKITLPLGENQTVILSNLLCPRNIATGCWPLTVVCPEPEINSQNSGHSDRTIKYTLQQRPAKI